MAKHGLHRTTVVAGTAVLVVGLLQGGAIAQAAAPAIGSPPSTGTSSTAGTSPSTGPPVGPDIGNLSPAQVRTLAPGANQSVIVVFKNQVSELPATPANTAARAAAVGSIQAPLVRELSELGAPAVTKLTLINAVTASISPAEETRLKADPAVAEVVPNATFHVSLPSAANKVALPATAKTPSSSTVSDCQPGANGIELDPEALSAIHANSNLPGQGPTASSLGITGAGVTVAYMAEGINTANPDFIRSDNKSVFVATKDFTGEGTVPPPPSPFGSEAELDASSVAAQGQVVYEIPLSTGGVCKFQVLGAAPGASLIGLKVFPNDYDATSSAILQGIDYAVTTAHVNVLNQSFGYNPLPDTTADLVRLADDAAVAAGTVVDVSTGDAGPTSTQGSPSTDPAVISAGATTTYRTYAQGNIDNYSLYNGNGWENDNLSGLSSGGATEGLKGPNVVAPGDLNWVTCNVDTGVFGACISGGTSEAAPLTSATAALVIQAYRKTHGGATPTPALVKQIITSTATDLGLPADQQGSGIINSYQAVLEAESIKTPAATPKATGMTISTSLSDITATAPAGTTLTKSLAVTNNGSGTQTVSLNSRILSPPTSLLSSKFSEAGASWTKKFTFTVAPGTSHLAASAATLNSNGAAIDVTLIDPLGRYAIDGLPQGATGTSNVGVRYPDVGTWTAYVTDFGAPGTAVQPVAFSVQASNWVSFGSVTPSKLTLASHASGTVTVSVPTPASGGDTTAAVSLSTPFSPPTSIPIALRSLVAITNGTGHFSASVIGGNGRGGAPAATQYFAFDVPAGQAELNASTSYPTAQGNAYSTYLISPQGEALGHASNQLVIAGSAAAPVTTPVGGTTSHVLAPEPGRWILIVAFANPANGVTVNAELNGTIGFAPVATATTGLPTSAKTDVAVGSSTTVEVTVTNHSAVPQSYFLDARTSASVTKTLKPLASSTGVSLPLVGDIPQWIVPTDTTGLLGQVDATAPVTFDMSPYLGNFGGELNGDPQIGATSQGDTATATWADNPITPGVWNLDPGLVGVYGAKGSPAETANLSLSATTAGFNSAFVTSYGDLWTGNEAIHPVIVSPGQTTTLYASLAPSQAGTVSGTLYLDTASSIDPYGNPIITGDQASAIPYSYTATDS